MTHSQTDTPGPDIPAPPIPEPSPSPPPIEDPPLGDPPPGGPEVPIDDPQPVLVAAAERDLGGPEDTIAGPGDGTEGPDAPDEPGPRPPGFPDPAGGDDDAPEDSSRGPSRSQRLTDPSGPTMSDPGLRPRENAGPSEDATADIEERLARGNKPNPAGRAPADAPPS